MTLRSAAAALILLAGTCVWSQSAEPSAAATPAAAPLPLQRPQGLSPRRSSPMQSSFRSTNAQNATPRQRLQDLQDTVTSMQMLLKQMSAKAPAKDSLAKANLDMWALMIKHLDKQLGELRLATAAHEEMEARRAAMYKQADDKAAAEAHRSADTARAIPASAPSATTTGTAPVTPSAAPGTPAPAATVPSAGSTTSPN